MRTRVSVGRVGGGPAQVLTKERFPEGLEPLSKDQTDYIARSLFHHAGVNPRAGEGSGDFGTSQAA